MTPFHRFLAAAGLVAALTFPAMTWAAEPDDYAADARQTGGDPPLIPHLVRDDATGKECLVCHKDGIKGAPQTSHPERLSCTQCHVAGEVKKKKIPVRQKSKR